MAKRFSLGRPPVYACRICRAIIGTSPMKRCTRCGYSPSRGESTAIR